MIDSKTHALAILEFALNRANEMGNNDIISSSTREHKRFGFSLYKEKFFGMIKMKVDE